MQLQRWLLVRGRLYAVSQGADVTFFLGISYDGYFYV